MSESCDGKSRAVAEWLVLRGGSCALQDPGQISISRPGGWTDGIPSQLCLQLLTGLHTALDRKWDVNYLYLLVINTVLLESNQRVYLNTKTSTQVFTDKCFLLLII